MDDQNNPVFCDPGIGTLQTTDDRVFTATVTPWTDRVAHSYTLRLTVPGGAVRSSVGSKPNEEPEGPLEVRVSPPGSPEPMSSIALGASPGSGVGKAELEPADGRRGRSHHPLRVPLRGRGGGVWGLGERSGPGTWSDGGEPGQRPGIRL